MRFPIYPPLLHLEFILITLFSAGKHHLISRVLWSLNCTEVMTVTTILTCFLLLFCLVLIRLLVWLNIRWIILANTFTIIEFLNIKISLELNYLFLYKRLLNFIIGIKDFAFYFRCEQRVNFVSGSLIFK